MTIPSDMKTRPASAIQKAASAEQKNTAEGTGTEVAFDGLLKKALSSNRPTAAPPQAAAPIGKASAENLLRQMQAHMNMLPWRTLVDDGADASPMGAASKSVLTSLLDGKSRPSDTEMEVSKLRQEMRKNGGSPTVKDMDRIIELAARTHGVDADLIRRVIKTESNFNPGSRSPKGAMGLMQLMPETARELGVADPYDPVDNVMAGTRYLKGLIDRYGGDEKRALAAYNWGMGNVEKYPDRLPAETRRYVSRIMQSRWKT